MKTTKNKNEIESLLFSFSTPEEKNTFFDSKIKRMLKNFEELYQSLEDIFNTKDKEYGEAFELLVSETNNQLKKLVSDFSKKTGEINSLINELKSKSDKSESDLKSQINDAKKELKYFTSQHITSLDTSRKMFFDEITKIVAKSEKSFSKIDDRSNKFSEEIESLRNDIITKYSNINHGGGSMNRQILVGGVNPLTRYTDYNLIAGAGITITTANDDANRRVNLTIVSSGSSSFETPVGTVDDSNLTFTVSNTPKYIIVNGAQYVVGTGLFSSYAAGTITLSSAVGTGGFIRSAY